MASLLDEIKVISGKFIAAVGTALKVVTAAVIDPLRSNIFSSSQSKKTNEKEETKNSNLNDSPHASTLAERASTVRKESGKIEDEKRRIEKDEIARVQDQMEEADLRRSILVILSDPFGKQNLEEVKPPPPAAQPEAEVEGGKPKKESESEPPKPL